MKVSIVAMQRLKRKLHYFFIILIPQNLLFTQFLENKNYSNLLSVSVMPIPRRIFLTNDFSSIDQSAQLRNKTFDFISNKNYLN